MILAFAVGFSLEAHAAVFVDGSDKVSDDFVMTTDMAAKAACASSFRFEATDRALVVHLVAVQPNMKDVKLSEADGVWKCLESFELFLDPTGSGKSLHHLAVAANDTLMDVATKSGRGSAPWKADIKATSTGWTAVMTVPWSALGLKKRPAVGDHWRFNIGRNYRTADGQGVHATFARTGIYFKNPAAFEDLYFGTTDEVAAVLKAKRQADMAELAALVERKGLTPVFRRKLDAFAAGGRTSLLDEIRDELFVIDALNKKGN